MGRRCAVASVWFRITGMVALLCLGMGIASADDITYPVIAYQNSGDVAVPLGPGLNPLLGPTFPNSDSLVFGTIVGPGLSGDFSAVLDIAGQQLDTPNYQFSCPPDQRECVLLSSFDMPTTYSVAQAVLIIDVNGVAQSQNFQYQTPVPEPGSIVLFGSAVAGFAGVLRRRQKPL
jgi:hypothetical protein